MASKEPTLGAKLVVEFIGTFLLITTIALCLDGKMLIAPLPIGGVIIALVYMGGPISGAHYNPAVTLAMVLRRLMDWRLGLQYTAVQVLSALAAGMVAWGTTKLHPEPHPGEGYGVGHAFLVEAIFTFALVYVALKVATTKTHENNQYYGIAIGMVVLAAASAAGPISGGVINPAVATGLIFSHWCAGGNVEYMWLYWLSPLLGAAAAVPVFLYTNAHERYMKKDDALLPDEEKGSLNAHSPEAGIEY